MRVVNITLALALGFIAAQGCSLTGGRDAGYSEAYVALNSREGGQIRAFPRDNRFSGDSVPATRGPRDNDPALAPDGKRLAFSSFRDGQWDVYVIRDGHGVTNEVKVSDALGDSRYPTWSPTGSELIFVSTIGGSSRLYRWDGEIISEVARPFSRAQQPAWSPDGTHVAASVDDGGGSLDIYVIDVLSGAYERMTGTPDVNETSPSWSPDGNALLFVSEHGSGASIVELTIPDRALEELINFLDSPVEDPIWCRFKDRVWRICFTAVQDGTPTLMDYAVGGTQRVIGTGAYLTQAAAEQN
jgi:TolB protein